jgi:ABC-type multidrug transport system fused ATPase/permease subunit
MSELIRYKPPAHSQRVEHGEDEEKFKPISMKMVRRLAGWMKPYWKLYLLSVLCGSICTAMELVPPWVIKHLVDEAIPSGVAANVIHWTGLWAGAMVMVLLFDALQMGLTAKSGESVVQDLRLAIFNHLQRLSMSFFDKTKLGRIITRGTSDLGAMRGVLVNGVNTLVLNTLLMVGAGAMIAMTSWRLFLVVAWLSPLLGILNHYYRRHVGHEWQVVRAGFSRVASNLAENITGVRVVSAFNRQETNLGRFNELQDENTWNNLRVANMQGLYQPILETSRFFGQMIILAYGGVGVLNGRFEAGTVLACFFYWDLFMRPTINMGNFFNSVMQAMASGERIFSLLDTVPEVQDRPDAMPLAKVDGRIVFDHVTFAYVPGRPVLHDICLEIPAGKTYALVGATGCGKSTTLSLLARFYELSEGRILVDNHDVRDVTIQSLHKQMGMVLQQNYLFSGTVLDNIRYPRPDATDEDVHNAAKALGVHARFLGLAKGYQTVVGERGSSLSLGLRQLICFTRVLLANPRIFLLDEATSSIDTVTELEVQTALDKLVKDRTTVIVAHRLSTVVRADCIVVLSHGKIIEQGTHAELLERQGFYAQLYQRFASGQGDLDSLPHEEEPPQD